MSRKKSAGWANCDNEEDTEIRSTHSSDHWGIAKEKTEDADSWDDSNWGEDLLLEEQQAKEPLKQVSRGPTPDSAFAEIKELDLNEKQDFNIMKEELSTLSQKLSEVENDNLQLTADLRKEEEERKQAESKIKKQKSEIEILREQNTLLEKHLSDALKQLALPKPNSYF